MILRPQWEEYGYKISDHTGSPPVDPALLEKIVIHYPGGGTYPDSPTVGWIESYSQRMQKDYVDNRGGYSIGYNFGVAKNGLSVQWRGLEYACAANGWWAINRNAVAIQLIINIGEAATDEQIVEVRNIIDQVQQFAGKKLEVVGHRDVNATGCPGDEAYAQVLAGVFDVPYPNEAVPPPIIPGENIDMLVIWRHPDYVGSYLIGGGTPIILTPALKAHYEALGVAEIAEAHDQLLAQCAAATGYTPIPK